jgi:hypothetical protein
MSTRQHEGPTPGDDVDKPGVDLVAKRLEEHGIHGARAHNYATILVEYDVESRRSMRRALRLAQVRIATLAFGSIAAGIVLIVQLMDLGYTAAAIVIGAAIIPLVAAAVYRWFLLPGPPISADDDGIPETPEGTAHAERLASIASLPRLAG